MPSVVPSPGRDQGSLLMDDLDVAHCDSNQIIEHGTVHADGASISEVGDASRLAEANPRDERVDAQGKTIMPGNICGHTHFCGAFAQGMAIPGEPPRDFPEIQASCGGGGLGPTTGRHRA